MRRLARLLAFAGAAGTVVLLARIHASANKYEFTGSSRFAWTLAYIALLWLTTYGSGLPDVVRGRRRSVATAIVAPLSGAMAISVVQLFLGDALLPRFVVLGSIPMLSVMNVACVALASRGHALARERDRVYVVATAAETDVLRDELRQRAEHPAQVVGATAPDVLARDDVGLVALVSAARATVLVLNREAQASQRIVHQAAALHESGVRVRTLVMFHEQWLGKLPVSELERVSLMFDIREVHRAVYLRVTRVIDLAFAIGGGAVLAVVVPVVWLGNLVANRGPMFYRQPRVGKGGTTFNIAKFRTMRPSTSSEKAGEWTSHNDPRVTPFGRFLRTSHLDELPQVLNILHGDLSVVGPRPEQPHYVDELTEKIPFYALRHLVRPGLTGWAQVKYGYAGTEQDALEKLQYEFYYLRHQGLTLDARIIGRTIRSVLGRQGR